MCANPSDTAAIIRPSSAKRRRSSAVRSDADVKKPSYKELATHEIVGWLLGAVIAMGTSSKVNTVPALLSKKRHQELDLLHATLAQHMAKSTPPHSNVRFLNQLLCELRAYCCGEGPFAKLWLLPAAGTAQIIDAFVSHVKGIIEWRCQWHTDRAEFGSAGDTASFGTENNMLVCESLNECRPKRRRLSRKSCGGQAEVNDESLHSCVGTQEQTTSTPLEVQVHASTPIAVGCTKRVAVDDLAGNSRIDMSDEEWPKDKRVCEGCGRDADGTEAWGPLNASLCSRCCKARVPLMWALTRECFRSLAGPAGLMM